MEIDLVFKIAAIGIIVAVLNQLLIRSGREDQAMMTTPPKRTLPTPRSSTHCSSERSMRSRRQAASHRPSTVTTLRA